MVKRNDAKETNLGSARDTDTPPGQPATDSTTDDPLNVQEGWYKPEMGTIFVDHRPVEDEV